MDHKADACSGVVMSLIGAAVIVAFGPMSNPWLAAATLMLAGALLSYGMIAGFAAVLYAPGPAKGGCPGGVKFRQAGCWLWLSGGGYLLCYRPDLAATAEGGAMLDVVLLTALACCIYNGIHTAIQALALSRRRVPPAPTS